MFNKETNKIVLVNLGSIFNLPPAINLIKCLLANHYKVHIISENVKNITRNILDNDLVSYSEVEKMEGHDILTRIRRRIVTGKQYRDYVSEHTNVGDILWTTTDATVRILGKLVLNYQHIMEVTELAETTPLYNGAKHLHYPIVKYAQKAWKIVVPEMNRAYFQKIYWNLSKVPYVLPNKPYDIDSGNLSEEALKALEKIKNEKKKVVIYLGVFAYDRDLNTFAEAIKRLNDRYSLYLLGRVAIYGSYNENKKVLDDLLEKYPSVHYLGFFPAPMHLEFLKYAHIGLLPYYVNPQKSFSNQLNILYCAPNKIFEYAGFGIPMIGTDILGLKVPFEKYDIGICCPNFNAEEITEAIENIESKYEEMSNNCKCYFDSVDIDSIVNHILDAQIS